MQYTRKQIAKFVEKGQGYPLGLIEREIPIECRMLAIADAYDAMISDRPYRKALTHKEAIAELIRWKDTQFDAYLVDKFIAVIEKNIIFAQYDQLIS